MLFSIYSAAAVVLVFGTLSIPIGVRNSPLYGLILGAILYLLMAAFALAQLWMSRPFTTLFTVLGAVSFLYVFVLPLVIAFAEAGSESRRLACKAGMGPELRRPTR